MKKFPKRQESEIQLNIDLPADLHAAVKDYVQREGTTQKQVVEIALRRFLVAERALKAELRMKGRA